MEREIITDPLDAEDLWTDLRINLALLQEMNITEILLLFGFAWGNSVYSGDWVDEPTNPGQVLIQVASAEQNKYGSLGNDNLYITVPALDARLQYSYESDIHLSYSTPNSFVKSNYIRWTANNWFIESKKSRL
jgi:hypothetical protein